MFTYETTLRLRDTDAAGVLYFANIYNYAHEAIEAFLDSAGMNVGTILRSPSYALPVVHAEADYRRPILPGDRMRIQVQLERMGDTSFTFLYRMTNIEGEETAQVRIVHVVVDRQSGKSKPVPSELSAVLQQLQS